MSIKYLLSGFTLAVLMFSANTAVADLKAQSGKISGYIQSQQGSNGLFYFRLEGHQAEGCNVTERFAINDTSPIYEGTMSVVMAAFHSGSTAKVFYTFTNTQSDCTADTSAMDLRWVCVGSIPC